MPKLQQGSLRPMHETEKANKEEEEIAGIIDELAVRRRSVQKVRVKQRLGKKG
jgi:hypothetical protein